MPKKHRVIIDTNLWISFLLTRDYTKLDSLLSRRTTLLVFSEELINEFIEVAQRPKLKSYFSKDDLEILLHLIEDHAEYIDVKSKVMICRDSKDDFLLSLAKDGAATHLLTGDKDLLELVKFGKTTIETISSYLSQF